VVQNLRQRRNDKRGGVSPCRGSGGNHKATHSCGQENFSLERDVTDLLVARQHYPPLLSSDAQPVNIRSVSGKSLLVRDDVNAGLSKGVRHNLATEIAIDEEGEVRRTWRSVPTPPGG
jgi:hypothetical protein